MIYGVIGILLGICIADIFFINGLRKEMKERDLRVYHYYKEYDKEFEKNREWQKMMATDVGMIDNRVRRLER